MWGGGNRSEACLGESSGGAGAIPAPDVQQSNRAVAVSLDNSGLLGPGAVPFGVAARSRCERRQGLTAQPLLRRGGGRTAPVPANYWLHIRIRIDLPVQNRQR